MAGTRPAPSREDAAGPPTRGVVAALLLVDFEGIPSVIVSSATRGIDFEDTAHGP
jgi:hypothetical protein